MSYQSNGTGSSIAIRHNQAGTFQLGLCTISSEGSWLALAVSLEWRGDCVPKANPTNANKRSSGADRWGAVMGKRHPIGQAPSHTTSDGRETAAAYFPYSNVKSFAVTDMEMLSLSLVHKDKMTKEKKQ